MKPLLLRGHERPITQLKYNKEGDLLFSSAKDHQPTVWFTTNGERLGTYNGHSGAVWCLHPRWDTKYLLTGAADNSAKMWDVETGRVIIDFESGSAVRSCGFAYSGKQLFFTTDKTMGRQCEMKLFDIAEVLSSSRGAIPYLTIPVTHSKVTSSVWGPLDDYVITGHENGTLSKYCTRSGECVGRVRGHGGRINDIQKSADEMMFLTASKDYLSKLYDFETMQLLKTYKTDRPVNSAAVSPIREQVVLGGGQEAVAVAATSSRVGKFSARFFHLIFEEEVGRVAGHFGPINTLAFHPDGTSYSSGGEDGIVRFHVFDKSYYEFDFRY